MPWDMTKCVNGVPAPFADADAIAAVQSADFTRAVYVNTSEHTRSTRQAFAYVSVGGKTLCVVGHIHVNPATGAFTGPGHCYIPGWMNWQMVTPAAQAADIFYTPDGGAFPGKNRYPH